MVSELVGQTITSEIGPHWEPHRMLLAYFELVVKTIKYFVLKSETLLLIFSPDPDYPLMGQIQMESGFCPQLACCASQAIVDVAENMRGKIYCLFCKLGE